MGALAGVNSIQVLVSGGGGGDGGKYSGSPVSPDWEHPMSHFPAAQLGFRALRRPVMSYWIKGSSSNPYRRVNMMRGGGGGDIMMG